MRVKIGLVFLLVWGAMAAYAAPVFVEGKDYKVLETNAVSETAPKSNTVMVKEFFSYGCPWCYKLEKPLKKWQKDLPKLVLFERVPVVFEAGWDVYAKAYYAASLLKMEKRLSAAIFEQVQEKEIKLDSNDAMFKFFVEQGVRDKVAQSAFFSSPTIDAKVVEGIQQMQTLQITSVPSFVINNHYKVDIAMMEGDADKLFRVIGYLIAKELVSKMHK